MLTDIVIIIIQNSNNQLFVHQRSDTDPEKPFPLKYGLGAGGKVNERESIDEAANRELSEELKIQINLEHLFSFPFTHPQTSYTVNVFRGFYNGELVPCKREFKQARWMNTAEIDELAKNEELCPDTKICYETFKSKHLKNPKPS